MAKTYERSRRKYNNVVYTVITAVLICVLFLMTIISFYKEAENEAYEMLHLQTKQIKDDLVLQIKSDKENLVTMANFAAKLYASGQGYDLMFDSFKPIGLFSRIGILNPDGKFITKAETVDLSGRISFEEEARLGDHITGRTYSYSVPDEEVVRAAVPVVVDGKTVAIIYGTIKIETINERYNNMAKELDAQLFVYDKETGKFIIDSVNENPGELSELKSREYNEGYSYEELVNTEKGFSSFKSIRNGENLYLHYSIIEQLDWGIMLARYESQVFAKTHQLSQNLLLIFALVMLIIGAYLQLVMKSEKNRSRLHSESSAIRKLLLETNEQYTNVTDATKRVKEFAGARSAFFCDTDGEDFVYIKPSLKEKLLTSEERTYFQGELFRYAANIHNAIGMMQITPNRHLAKTNPKLYQFLREHGIYDVSFAIIAEKSNHVSILGTINPNKSSLARKLVEDVAVCFSIAMYNKKHLGKTELAATTDSLTGAYNRVAYKRDVLALDAEGNEDFACIYIDVNELHLRNNKYGHAAGDAMLIYVANTLKEVFFGRRVYRMGGDEFLVFAENISQEQMKQHVDNLMAELEKEDYHVSIGVSFRKHNISCEELVREAEIRMYEAKAQYYQKKSHTSISEDHELQYVHIKTGIREIDTMISILSEHYNGIYRVSLDTNHAHRILMPAYLGYSEDEDSFSNLMTQYMNDLVHPDSRRAVMSFLNYDVIWRQLLLGEIPSVTYKKINGESVVLSVHRLTDDQDAVRETLWVFAKE